jgi:hypothetical protein
MAFYKGMGAVAPTPAVDPNQPWWASLFQTIDYAANAATQQPVQSVNALTAQVASTQQTLIYIAVGLGALLLLNRRKR